MELCPELLMEHKFISIIIYQFPEILLYLNEEAIDFGSCQSARLAPT
jgi:hypothetical protein